ncbi:ABC transporter permease [Plantactinospora sp. KLBMP9567]|uniref:ABC transporter permease n=1 Tax=Plantactinospora sp. KLBMP9567 TaxID=3085900 RepID=UPI002981CFC8|nr:FtsX-like permease family protein [Plantactinospora sp. KLBMP9567]MDW5322456.1 FtsX-like permease family protein [Plantactinospora sp. KLBMP9567]
MSAVLRLARSGLRGGNRATAIATVLVAALATTGVVAGLSVRDQGGAEVDRIYRDAGRPDLVVYGTPEALEAVRLDPAFAATAPVTPYLDAAVVLGRDSVDARVTTLLTGPSLVGRPLLRTGAWPAAGVAGEVVFDQAAATEAGIRAGDRVRLTVGGRPATLTVVGTAVDLTDCFYPDCAPIRLFVDPATLAALATPTPPPTADSTPTTHPAPTGRPTPTTHPTPAGAAPNAVPPSATPNPGPPGAGDPAGSPGTGRSTAGGRTALLVARLVDPGQADAVAARVGTRSGIEGVQPWPDTREDILVRDRIFGASLAGFGIFVLLAAAFVVAGTATARLMARRREIALLQSIGYTTRQVITGLLTEALLLGAVGVLAGWMAGTLLAPYLQIGLGGALGRPGLRIAPLSLLGSALLVGTVLAAATVLPAWRAVRQPVSEVLGNAPPRGAAPARVARMLDRLRLGPACRYGLGAVLTRPGRSALTAAALAVAVAAVVVGVGFTATVDRLIAEPARTGDPYDAVVVADGTAPATVTAALAGTPGAAGWYSQLDRRTTLGDQTFLSRAIGGDPADARFLIREGRPLRAPGEAIAGYGLLRRFGLQVGDTIEVRAGDTPLRLTVVGWYSETEDTGELLMYRAEMLPGVPPDAYLVSAGPTGTPQALAAALRDRLGPGITVHARTSDPDDLGTYTLAMRLLAALVLAVSLANLAAALLTGARERARTLGVLRAVGFTVRQTLAQSATGGAALGLAAALAGLPIGLLVFRLLTDQVLVGIGAGPGLAEPPSAMLLAATVPATALAGAFAGVLAAGRLARTRAADLVRYE